MSEFKLKLNQELHELLQEVTTYYSRQVSNCALFCQGLIDDEKLKAEKAVAEDASKKLQKFIIDNRVKLSNCDLVAMEFMERQNALVNEYLALMAAALSADRAGKKPVWEKGNTAVHVQGDRIMSEMAKEYIRKAK